MRKYLLLVKSTIIQAKAGSQGDHKSWIFWIPAFAGMAGKLQYVSFKGAQPFLTRCPKKSRTFLPGFHNVSSYTENYSLPRVAFLRSCSTSSFLRRRMWLGVTSTSSSSSINSSACSRV